VLNPQGVFESEAVRFDYHAPIAVHSLAPPLGPAAAEPRVSLDAYNLAPLAPLAPLGVIDARCRFNHTEVVPTYTAAGMRHAYVGMYT